MGSDHFSIQITLHPRFRAIPKKLVNIVNWNTFRIALSSHTDSIDFYQDIKFALQETTIALHVRIASPHRTATAKARQCAN